MPAPATLQLLTLVQAPTVGTPLANEFLRELVTPTGAVLTTSLLKFSQPNMILGKVGYGAGSRECSRWPSVLRLRLGEEADTTGNENLVLLKTNIDNINPEIYGYFVGKLFSLAAADVWFMTL